MNRWRRFRRLAKAERSALLSGLLLQPLISCALKLLGFRRLQRALAKILPCAAHRTAATGQATQAEAQMVARMVASANREGLVRGKCLEQSLTLWWLLRMKHLPAELRIGVRKEGAELLAHAWVELDSVVLNHGDDLHHGYAAFDRDLGALETHTR
jgi:Transglutaminase-like superfamily